MPFPPSSRLFFPSPLILFLLLPHSPLFLSFSVVFLSVSLCDPAWRGNEDITVSSGSAIKLNYVRAEMWPLLSTNMDFYNVVGSASDCVSDEANIRRNQWLKCNGTQGNSVSPPPIYDSKRSPTSDCYNARERHTTIVRGPNLNVAFPHLNFCTLTTGRNTTSQYRENTEQRSRSSTGTPYTLMHSTSHVASSRSSTGTPYTLMHSPSHPSDTMISYVPRDIDTVCRILSDFEPW